MSEDQWWKYEVKIPMQLIGAELKSVNILRVNRMPSIHNIARGLLVDFFISKYKLFPTEFLDCKHTQQIENNFMVIRFEESGVETRPLRDTEKGGFLYR
jgi:hypothetical protein